MKFLAFAVALLASSPAHAVVINANRPPASAVDPNTIASPYSGVGNVGGGCTGTAITSTLVLTAAHCFSANAQRTSFRLTFSDAPSLSVGGTASLFPGWNTALGAWQQLGVPDLAMVRLDTALPSYVRTYGIYSTPSIPVGSAFSMVGYGRTGTGVTGEIAGSNSATVKRYGFNVVDRVEAGGKYFTADLDGGSINRLGQYSFGTQETITARGDSGGPAFFNPAEAVAFGFQTGQIPAGTLVKLTPYVNMIFGVTSYGTNFGQGFGAYGSTATWTHVSPHLSWINSFSNEVRTASFESLVTAASDDSALPFAQFADSPPVNVVPLPAGAVMLLSGMFGLAALRRRRAR